MYKLIVSLRYLRKKKLNLFAIAGVAIGVMVLIVVLSVMTGFDEEMRSRIRGTLSHLIVERWGSGDFVDFEQVMAGIEKIKHVEACSPHLEGLALFKIGPDYKWGQFRGIDLGRECRATEFAEYWRTWRGTQALEECRAAFAGGEWPSGKTSWGEDDVRHIILERAKRLRRKDFDELKRTRRRWIRKWAATKKLDLEAAWRKNDEAMPTWGAPVGERETPVIPGRDLLVIGRDMDGALVGYKVGDKLVLVTLVEVGATPEHRLRRCRVVGQFKSGMYEYDLHNVYMPLAHAQRLVLKKGKISNLNIRLDDYANADIVRATIMGLPTLDELEEMHKLTRGYVKRMGDAKAAGAISGALDQLRLYRGQWLGSGNPRLKEYSLRLQRTYFQIADRMAAEAGLRPAKRLQRLKAIRERIEKRYALAPEPTHRYRVSTWEDRRRNILRAVEVERRVMAVILTLIMLVAGFLIFSLLHTTVVEKTRDIGVLKAIGGTVGGIMAIFLLNGLLIGVIGSALGTIGGLLLRNHLNDIEDAIYWLTRWRVFPREVYAFDEIPVSEDPLVSIIIIASAAVLVSFLAAIHPARRAAKLEAVEAIRYE